MMDVSVEAPDLRGTVVLVNLTISFTRNGVKVQGAVEIQAVTERPDA